MSSKQKIPTGHLRLESMLLSPLSHDKHPFFYVEVEGDAIAVLSIDEVTEALQNYHKIHG